MRHRQKLEFYVVVPLGFEKEAALEIQEISELKLGAQLSIDHVASGGIEISSQALPPVLELQKNAKLPSRILFRVFKKSSLVTLEELAEVVKKEPWSVWIDDKKFFVKVDSQHSKLHNEKWLKKHLSLLNAHFVFQESSESLDLQRLYFRWEDDQFTLSLDLSGEHLHRRGYRKWVGLAPLRENVAAGLLRIFFKDLSQAQARHVNLVDGFCGSGTFLFEALGLYARNPLRRYAADRWLSKSQGSLQSEKTSLLQESTHWSFASIRGFDKDPEMLTVQQQNEQLWRKLNEGQGLSLSSQVMSWHTAPFFSVDLSSVPCLWWISNLPFEQRLKDRVDWVEFLNFVKKHSNLERIGLLMHRSQVTQFESQVLKDLSLLNFKQSRFSFSNNGLPVQFMVLQRSN